MFKSEAFWVDHSCMPIEAGTVAAPEDADRHICCTLTNVLLGLIRTAGGEAAVAALLKHAATTRQASYLEDIDNWISLDEACALLAAGVHQTEDPTFARRVGEQTLHRHVGTQVATLLRSLGSPEAVLRAVAQAAPKFSTVTEMEAIEAGPGHAVVRATSREGFTRRPLLCDWTAGMLTGTPILFGLPLAHVEETECQARGGAQCLYTVTWDAELAVAAADPQQRVTALEAQMAAMSERLQSAYATASDLISTENLDTVLHRIVERAANAVRAPGFVLAVSPEPGAELQVYSHGIENREAQVLARATRERTAPVSDSTLVVDVTSSRRNYGQLIARYPGASKFFPQDREALGLYAKHAAAVLDMATALQESAQRHEQVSSLLSLSHGLLSLSQALAQAGTSQEVADRLAVAVPEVVDCDRMAVWLWDDSEEHLKSLSVWGRRPEQVAYLLGLTISAEDTPYLARMAAEPQPVFFDEATEDPYLCRLMSTLEASVLAVIPIVVRDIFLGALSVSVTDRPERLRPEGELMERLTGVAALAAPAIQNGRLVDTLRHNASHDGLTGLLNLVGFRQHIDRALINARPGDEQVGLLFVDLNDFKGVNDLYGHEAGDELLRQAAERLRATGRGDDEVARLGGDEFAIVLADVHRDDQVRAAEQRVRAAFAEPFLLGDIATSIGASVGGVVWPDDGQTVNELVRRADAAMYKDKAKLRRAAQICTERRATATSPST
jgi:diguanylate cyclase (GGDEF)-like protein